ncbi:MAG: DUF4145 domain-containing protein [Bacteroidales bacterium]|jgi:hypothetical protein|nr:DUF4145 domain-containing protein [Bacteroidales bacterium]
MVETKILQQELDVLFSQFIPDVEKNYIRIRKSYLNEYGLPELDPIRHEICKCLVLGLYQASITLTNHLIEKYLKFALIYKEKKKEEKIVFEEMDLFFLEAKKKYGNKDLGNTINLCKRENIINKKQKDTLHEIRETFRNAYSHADMDKTFQDLKIPLQIVYFDNKTQNIVQESELKEFKISDIPLIHGVAQWVLAKRTSFNYFEYIDDLIRTTKQNIEKFDTTV